MPDTSVRVIKEDSIPQETWDWPEGTRFIWIPPFKLRRKWGFGPQLYVVGGKKVKGGVHDPMLPLLSRG